MLLRTVQLACLCCLALAQCSSRCPPLNSAGEEVPSLCPGERAPSDYLNQTHATCWPPVPRAPTSFHIGTWLANDVNGDGRIDGRDAKSQQLRVIVLSQVWTGCNAGRREAEQYQDLAESLTAERSDEVVFITALGGGAEGSNPAT